MNIQNFGVIRLCVSSIIVQIFNKLNKENE